MTDPAPPVPVPVPVPAAARQPGLRDATGRCLCGAVRYACTGVPLWQGHCHCDSCRRATGAGFASWFGMADGHWAWTGATPAVFASSPGIERSFCATCGAALGFRAPDRWPGEMHFLAASLEDPRAFAPESHSFWEEHLPWVQPADELPRQHGSAGDPEAPRPMRAAEAPAVLSLLQQSFAFMEGRIDPPSSLAGLDAAAVLQQMQAGEIWVVAPPGPADTLLACVFLTPKPDRLYVGKLAVAEAARGRGLARRLIARAAQRATAMGLAGLELQVRIELTGNHAAFRAMGFVEAARTAHPGYDRPTSLTFYRPVG